MSRAGSKFVLVVALALWCLCSISLSAQPYSVKFPDLHGPFSWADRVMNSTTIARGGEVYRLRAKTAELYRPQIQLQSYDASFLQPRSLEKDFSFYSYAIGNQMYEDAAALLFADGLYPKSDSLWYLRGLLCYEIKDFSRANECFSKVEGPGVLLQKSELFKEVYATTPSIPLKYTNRSPVLAAAMSAVVPGAGKIYAGDLHSGVSTFLIVGALGAMTAESIAKLGIKDWRSICLSSVFSLFYIGNIYGSYLSVSIIQNTMSDASKATLLFDIRIPLHELR